MVLQASSAPDPWGLRGGRPSAAIGWGPLCQSRAFLHPLPPQICTPRCMMGRLAAGCSQAHSLFISRLGEPGPSLLLRDARFLPLKLPP